MNFILSIDTTTENALVTIAEAERVIARASNESSRQHASFLHTAIQQVLANAGIGVSDLKAIAVAGGPGSYTGIRVGMATAKGLCFAAKIPLIMFNSLELIALSCIELIQDAQALYCPMIDARRMEVFTAVYDAQLQCLIQPAAVVINDSWQPLSIAKKIYLSGSGAAKAFEAIKDSGPSYDLLHADATAESLAALAWKKLGQKDFAHLVDSKPLYLKEFYTTASIR